MNRRLVTTIISRTLLVIGAGLVLVFGYWIVQISLAPVAVPPVPPARKNITFDNRLDVSRNTIFTKLKAIGPMEVPLPETGRSNPFVAPNAPAPVVLIPISTTTTTSTASAASTTTTELMLAATSTMR